MAARVRPSAVWLDESDGTLVLPAGEYDIDSIAILGGFGLSSSLNFETGARLVGTEMSFNNVVLNSGSTSPIMHFAGAAQGILTFDNGAALQTAGAASGPMILVDGSSALSLFLRYYGFMVPHDPAATIIEVELGSAVYIATDVAGLIADNSLDGAGEFTVNDLTGIAVLNRNPNISHTQLGSNISYSYG